jgi:PAS domain S-box-containing protein
MNVDNNTAGKKITQEVDAKVLGRILAAQNIDFVLPDIVHVTGFFSETLNTIPGIQSSYTCLQNVTGQRGETWNSICEDCQTMRSTHAVRDNNSAFGLDFQCALANHPGIDTISIASLDHHFGFFIFQVRDPDLFRIYKPFINNLANYVALSLENRIQRDLLQRSYDEKEREVEVRTRELEIANAHLQAEIEVKRQAEEALKREQMLLNRIMETSPVGITLVDHEGHIAFANYQAEKVLGLSREEITQRKFNTPDWHITTNVGAPLLDEDLPFQQVMSTGQPVHDVQHMITWPDGQHLFLSINGAPILNETGTVESVVFTIENITERKETDMRLIASERHFSDLVEN